MNKYQIIALCGAVGYIAIWAGLVLAVVGDIPEPATEPYNYWHVLVIISNVTFPVILGYYIGKGRGSE